MEKNPQAIAHQTLEGDDGVLTATTKELQKFILAHAQTEGTWGEPSDMKRKTGPAGPPKK